MTSAYQPLTETVLFQRIRLALPERLPVYLVGGAVRDAMLRRPVHDMDFVLPESALRVGRRVADALGGAYYPLDEVRQYARVVLIENGSRMVIDFAVYQGPDLESDLRNRDFTVNAMAAPLHSAGLVDPLEGAADLRAKLLRACTPDSLQADPVRILRGVRLAAALRFRLEPGTLQLMRQAVPAMEGTSVERLRDELFRLLESPNPAASLDSLHRLGALERLLPEVTALVGVGQSAPHQDDVYTHTLEVVRQLCVLVGVLAPEFNPDSAANLNLGLVSMRLGRFRQQLGAHLAEELIPGRGLYPLLLLAALYHDAGKALTRQVDPAGKVTFYQHPEESERLLRQRLDAFHLSNAEIDRAALLVAHHMRPLLLLQGEGLPSRRAIYRFFRAAGQAGVDVCLHSLADTLATYGPTLPAELWQKQLDMVRLLLEAWWEHPQEQVAPSPLLNGNDLLREFGRPPGPWVGRLLEALREAQASGEVSQRDEALQLVRSLMAQEAAN